MTEDRDLKRRVRARAAKTGESYQTARRQLLGERPTEISESDRQAVDNYFRDWWAAARQFRSTGRPFGEFPGVPVPLSALQAAALAHPNPKTRRACLGVLDHEANDESMDVFRRCLADPVPRVRLAALHGLGCQRCKHNPVDSYDVAPDLMVLARTDPSPKVRQAVVAGLAVLNDAGAKDLLRQLVSSDADPVVRATASAALEGRRGARLTRRSVTRRLQQQPAILNAAHGAPPGPRKGLSPPTPD
jgi:hypothetical protein